MAVDFSKDGNLALGVRAPHPEGSTTRDNGPLIDPEISLQLPLKVARSDLAALLQGACWTHSTLRTEIGPWGYEPRTLKRDWRFIAEQPAPAPHLANPEGCAALSIVLLTVPRVSRSSKHLSDAFNLDLLHATFRRKGTWPWGYEPQNFSFFIALQPRVQ